MAENSTAGVTQYSEAGAAALATPLSGAASERGESAAGGAALAVVALTAILYLVRLGARALWASEFRWGEIAREMHLTRNYFWPTINGRVYFDKPLGSYWLVLAVSGVTTRLNEAVIRLPSALAGVMAVGLLIVLVRRLYDLRTGVAAGFILATSFSFAFWARTASADTETVAGELAVLVIYTSYENRAGWWTVPMWCAMALSSLMKGLLGFVLPIMVIGVYSCVAEGWPELERRVLRGSLKSRVGWLVERNGWFFQWRTTIAITVAGVIYLAPFAISYLASGSAKGIHMVYRENVERYFAPFDHRGPLYLYAYVIFALMAPWSAFLPAALVNAHRRGVARPDRLRSDRLVLAFFWTTFIFFTLSGSRRSYYLLPILPAAAILVARLFLVAEHEVNEASRILLKAGFAIVVAAVGLSAVILAPPWLRPAPYSLLPSLPRPRIFAACWLVSFCAGACAVARYSRMRVLLGVSVASYLLFSYLFFFAMPAGDRWRGEKLFAETAHQLIDGHSGQLAAFKTQPPVFYLRLTEPVAEYNSATELESGFLQGRTAWVILRRRDVAALHLPASEIACEPAYPWDSQEHRLNALVLMKLGPRPSL